MRLVLYFLWLLPPLMVWVLVHQFGTPLVLINAHYHGRSTAPVYTSCTYITFSGAVALPASGHCPWVRLAPEGDQ
ncbi:MAG: hypothetical protein AAGF94_18660 [Pseudomonadota bacterium]